MTRDEKLRYLGQVLKLAADKARGLSSPHARHPTREEALAIQIEGIAMELEALGSSNHAPQTSNETG